MKPIYLPQALQALQGLRDAAGSEPEQFPLQAFVGMISDEVQTLREQGKNDEQIVSIIKESSGVEITAAELADNYATPEERHQHG